MIENTLFFTPKHSKTFILSLVKKGAAKNLFIYVIEKLHI